MANYPFDQTSIYEAIAFGCVFGIVATIAILKVFSIKL